MKLGLNAAMPHTAIDDAKEAERAGFDYLGCGEHLFFHGPMPNAFVQLAAAAGATHRIRLVSTVAILPLYPAALVAKLAASLDVVSGGRFELGLGAGGEFPPEFHAAGVEPAERFRRMDEGLAVIRALFDGGPVSRTGEFARLDDVQLDPAPVQPGGPPIWLGGRKAGAIRRAARFASVWMPYLVDPEQMADSLSRVREQAAGLGRDPRSVDGAVFLWTCADPDGRWARETGTDHVSATYAQDFRPLAGRYLALGTPDEVVDRIRQFEAAGADRVLIQIAAPDRYRRRVVATLAEHVLPRLV